MKRILAGFCVAWWMASGAGSAGAAVITGVCPDGSMFIVPRAELIPCRDSKRVEPSDMPPIRPQNLPRPYGWELFNRSQDPNNPYNIVDTGRAVRDVDRPDPRGPESIGASAPESGPEARVASAQRPDPLAAVSAAPPPTGGSLDLGLAEEEVRDLRLIVEYSQQRAPATLLRGSSEDDGMVLRLAQSRSFDARLRDAARRAGTPIAGPVVLFSATTPRQDAFHANLTFVQGHIAYHPEHEVSSQIGVIDGRLGELGPGEGVLGYVVLPAHVDLSQPMDIYWDDRQVSATLRP